MKILCLYRVMVPASALPIHPLLGRWELAFTITVALLDFADEGSALLLNLLAFNLADVPPLLAALTLDLLQFVRDLFWSLCHHHSCLSIEICMSKHLDFLAEAARASASINQVDHTKQHDCPNESAKEAPKVEVSRPGKTE